MVETQLCKLRHTPDTLIGRSWSQRAARVAPRANAKVPPHPGRISSHLRFRNPSISLQLQQRGDENADPPGRYHPTGGGNPNPTGLMLIGWGTYGTKPARGESCPSGQRRGLAAPGREKLPSTGQKSFHIPTTPTREENAFRSKAPRRV